MTRTKTGFSLIEILIVLFIVSILVTLASVNIGSDEFRARLETDAKHLSSVAKFALDEAQLSGRDYGLLLVRQTEKEGNIFFYRWLRLGKTGWRTPEIDADAFSEGFFDQRVQLELELDDSPFNFTDTSDSDSNLTPQIIFFSSGETTPGRIRWRLKDTGEILCTIHWDIFGNFTFVREANNLGDLR